MALQIPLSISLSLSFFVNPAVPPRDFPSRLSRFLYARFKTDKEKRGGRNSLALRLRPLPLSHSPSLPSTVLSHLLRAFSSHRRSLNRSSTDDSRSRRDNLTSGSSVMPDRSTDREQAALLHSGRLSRGAPTLFSCNSNEACAKPPRLPDTETRPGFRRCARSSRRKVEIGQMRDNASENTRIYAV